MRRQRALDRTNAAGWCARLTGQTIGETTVRFWERRGLLPKQQPGRKTPAAYTMRHLVLLAILAEMRKVSVRHRAFYRALRRLPKALPAILRNDESTVALTSTGQVVSGSELGDFFRDAWQTRHRTAFAWGIDVRRIVRDARRELDEIEEAAA